VKFKSLQDKLELYYDRLKSPPKIIKNWAIIDLELFNSLKKIKLTSVNDIYSYEDEKIILLENKSKHIVIKITLNFVAIKITNNEYELNIKEWDLIAVDKNYIYKGNAAKPMTNKEIIELLGFKLDKKAKEDLEYFG
jgi:hypothetical protein